MRSRTEPVRITVVGVCGSGKSELERRLCRRGLAAAAVAQEHSYVPRLWRHQGDPDVLVYLAASRRTIRRRGRGDLSAAELREQRRRLADARAHAHVVVQTDRLTPADVEWTVLRHLVPSPSGTSGVIQMAATVQPVPAAQPGAPGAPASAAGSSRLDPTALEAIARRLRRDIVEMTTRAGSGHPSSSMSAIDVIVALYCGGVLRHDPRQPHDPDRDRFILSKGHASPALYAILAERGYFPRDEIWTLRRLGSPLEGHPNMRRLPGVEASTGSLGQGLSIGLGHALAARIDGRAYRTYVMTGDGEMDEGQVWEALMAGAQFRADNLTLIVDHNKAQQSNLLERVIDYRPLADKLRAFHWHVEEIDGHNMGQIMGALDAVRAVSGRPQAIVAHTVKGKGVSFVERDWSYHGKPLTADEEQRALEELKD